MTIIFFIDIGADMVRKDQQGLELPINFIHHFWVEVELVGMTFVFNKAQSLDGAYFKVGSASNWFVSHISSTKRVCSSFDGC